MRACELQSIRKVIDCQGRCATPRYLVREQDGDAT